MIEGARDVVADRSQRWAGLALAVVVGISGCAGAGGRRNADLERQGVAHRAGVPLEEARERLEEARDSDPFVRLGFYSVPLAADGSDSALAALAEDVAPETWDDPGRFAYRDGEWIVVVQTPAVQGEVARWAAARRVDAPPMVVTELRILTLPESVPGRLSELGFTPLEGGSNDPTDPVAYLADHERSKALLEIPGIETIAAPSLVTRAGQRGSLAITSQKSYVQDYEVYQVDDAVIADPVIGTIQDGLSVEIVARITEKDQIDLATTVAIAELRGIETASFEIDPTLEPVTIELPDLSIQRISERAVVGDGAAILFGGALLRSDRSAPWVLVRSTRIRPE